MTGLATPDAGEGSTTVPGGACSCGAAPDWETGESVGNVDWDAAAAKGEGEWEGASAKAEASAATVGEADRLEVVRPREAGGRGGGRRGELACLLSSTRGTKTLVRIRLQ